MLNNFYYLLFFNSFLIIDMKFIVQEIQSLRYELRQEQRQMTATLQKIQTMLETGTMRVNQTQTHIESFDKKYGLTLPLITYEAFMEFDNKIEEDRECRALFVRIYMRLSNIFEYYI